MDDQEALLNLAHELGDPSRGLAIAAEGNVSMRLGEDTMSIKASGCSLSSMTVPDLVDVPSESSLLESIYFNKINSHCLLDCNSPTR